MLRPFTLSLAVLTAVGLHAQLTITPGTPLEDLAAELEGLGVTITNVTMDCDPVAYGSFSGTSDLPLEQGLLFTTGDAAGVANQATNNITGVSILYNEDFDLMAISGQGVHDVCRLEFDCVPLGDTLLFNYTFGSEEYPEFICSYNDVFGLFLSGPGISGPYSNGAANVALVPGTSDPVSINTVNAGYLNDPESPMCPAVNAEFYIDNSASTTVAYDGLTVNLVAQAVVEPGESYHFKLAIADASDAVYDSGVFLQSFSFRSTVLSTGVSDPTPGGMGIRQGMDGTFVLLPSGTQGSLQVFSNTGMLVNEARITSDRMPLDLHGQARGLYTVRVAGEPELKPARFYHE